MGKVVTPEPVLYISRPTANLMGLQAEDVVPVEQRGNYVFLQDKKAILDIRAIQDEMKRKKRAQQGEHRPIVSVAPDGTTPTVLLADNETEAEEVQDLLGQQYEKNEAALKERSQVIATDWVRHVNGIYPVEEFDEKFRDALQDRIKRHKQSPISDPARDPWKYARDNGYINTQFQGADIPK